MRILLPVVILLASCCLFIPQLKAEEPAPFRTDASTDKKLPWYQIQPGVFPPAGSAHYFAGELIQVDHVTRSFVIRNDRTDAQNRSHWDLPVAATMLPYGSISYHGAPAALEDIPLGTHLHGEYYIKDPNDKSKPLDGWHNRVSIDADFNRCFRIEDDFSFHTRQNQSWRIDEINLAEKKLMVTMMEKGEPVGDAKTFELLPTTRIWKGNGIAAQSDLAQGDQVQINITWATLYGPGRLREIWLDEESQKIATAHQSEVHQQYMRERGLPGWIDAVDNTTRTLTITFFGGIDPTLFDAFVEGDSAAVAVAEESLQMYDPVNDRKRGPILSKKQIDVQPGSGGVQIQIKTDLLLEGYRPRKIVRVYPSSWPVLALPMEEQLFGR